MPAPAKAKNKVPVTTTRPEPGATMDEDAPPLEPEEDIDRLHPSPVPGLSPGSDSSDDLPPVPDSFTGFERKDTHHQEQGEEENLDDDPEEVPDDPNLFIQGDEEPLGGFEGVTVTGRKAPKRSVHTDGHSICRWNRYKSTLVPLHHTIPTFRRCPTDQKKPEDRDGEKVRREDAPILAETFAKDHSTSAINTKALAIALHIALERKMNDNEYRLLTDNKTFTHWSKMLAAYLRHEKIAHAADGSISLEELAAYMPFVRQLCHYDHPDMNGIFGRLSADQCRSHPDPRFVPSLRTADTILYAIGACPGV